MRWIGLIIVFLCSSTGCSVKGFPQLDGTFHTPQQLRSAAAIATAQGRALTEIADQQQGMITSFLDTAQNVAAGVGAPAVLTGLLGACLLYTSDAADELCRVDLGGRRIIKKKFF